MSVRSLKLSCDLTLPLDAVTQKIAWLGQTGGGKTFGCKRMVEQMLAAGAQVVVLDGSGAWAGLRLGPKVFKIPVLGGLYGDIPLEPTAGALVADVIVDTGTNMVLDVSQMLDSERTRFATAFGERFFHRKKGAPSAVHLVLEECQDFVPENTQRGEERMLHEFQRLAKQGRAHGVGMSFISQRPQEISKKALNQAECVFAFHMNGPHERKAIQAWLSSKGFEGERLSDILPTLEVGAPHVWSPSWLKVSKVVRILPIESLDTSRTPKVGDKKLKRKALRKIDLGSLEKAMAATLERAKADDPKALRARISELEKELKRKAPAVVSHKGVALKEFEVVVDRRHLEEMIKASEKLETGLYEARPKLRSMLEGVDIVLEGVGRLADITARATKRARQTGPGALAKRLEKAAPKAVATPRIDETMRALAKDVDQAVRVVSGDVGLNVGLSQGQRLVLRALAQHGVCERGQLRTLTGYRSSTINRLLSELSAKGFAGRDGKAFKPTGAGVDALGSDYEPLPTGAALLQHWLEKMSEGQRKMLEVLAQAYPGSVPRDQLAADTGYAPSTRNRLISELRAARVCTTNSDGVRMSEELA